MNSYLKILSLAALAYSLTSCSDDLASEVSLDSEYMPIHFKIKINDFSGQPETRGLAPGYKFSDGTSISELKCYVYNKSDGPAAEPSDIIDIDIKTINSNKGGDVTILLPKGYSYDVVFLGTSIPQTASSSKLYYNTTARTLNLNYNLISCNDEEIDCFFASRGNVTTETAFDQTIELTRPFAQLNIGTQDYVEYNTSTPIKEIAVSVDGIYNSVDLMTGDLVGSPIKADFNASAIPTGQSFPVTDYSYLSMNYLLVNLRKLVNVTMNINHISGTTPVKTIEISDVAVERNYRTNIYGKKLLTEEIQQK